VITVFLLPLRLSGAPASRVLPPVGRPLLLAFLLLALALPAPLRAQTGGPGEAAAELEARLPGLTGVERARALARLTDARKLDQPARAIAHGLEALRLFARHPDVPANVSTLNEMGWAYMQLGRYDEAVAHAEQGRRLAEAHGERAGLARALSNLGTIAQRRGDPERAESLFLSALEIQQALGNDRDAANSLNNLGFVYSTDLADYDRALDHHLAALRIRERLGEPEPLALSLNNIGIVYGRLRRYDDALAHFDSALVLRRRLGGKARIAATLSNMGDIHLSTGDLARALASHSESLELREATGDRSAISLAHRNLGLVLLAMGRVDSAHSHMVAALRLGDEVGDRGLVVGNLHGAAATERALGRLERAEAHAERALAIAQAMGSRELVRRSYEVLAVAREAAGRYQAALEAHRAFKAVSDSIFDAGSASRVATLERRFAEERRQRELERLRHGQQLYRVQAERRAVQRNAVAAAALLIGIAGVAAYRRRTGLARAAEELSVTDSLTGLRNRRYLQQTLDKDVAASVRRHRAASTRGMPAEDADLVFLLLDIDHFKQVNDQLGHAAGDRLLVDVARVLEEVSRESDVVVRWGGEEFLVVGRFTEREQAVTQAERIRRAVEEHVTSLTDDRALRVTCSIGFSVFPLAPAQPTTLGWEEVVSLADHGAYLAKRLGRNRSVGYLAGDGTPPEDVLHSTPDDIDRWVAEGRLARVVADEVDLEALEPVVGR
jgi:two-component system cell cycle response regulator